MGIHSKRVCLAILALAGLCVAAGQLKPAPKSLTVTFRVITYLNYYQSPTSLAEGSPGVFYTDTGTSTLAAISVTSKGAKRVLFSMPAGRQAWMSSFISAANGRFYSSIATLAVPGPSEVVSVGSAAGSAQQYPNQGLLPNLNQNLPDGSLLGTAANQSGIFFLVKCSLDGTVTSIYQFPAGDRPSNYPVYGSDGNYYGVASSGSSGSGYIYRVTPSGSLTMLYVFPPSTFMVVSFASPFLQAADGNLYGATTYGGANGTGTIYKVTLSGQYTLLYTFPAGLNWNPTALIEGSDGNLYGATWASNGQGIYQLFRITTSGQYTQVMAMSNGVTQGMCLCYLTQGSDGNIYGAAEGGGYSGGGVIFALEGLPIPAPIPQAFAPESGAPGGKVRIWGQNLLSAAVQFNGVPATEVSNSGPNYIWATVPAGAISGPITVTTPGGTAVTPGNFTVQ